MSWVQVPLLTPYSKPPYWVVFCVSAFLFVIHIHPTKRKCSARPYVCILDFLQNPELKKTVRGELCLPITVFRHPQA
ncbi:hypothetical protein [Moraxella lacunata]|uniref:hypothetical protein n=1 Tax=Moraxella lacunata TaxID=477 RepID=UPI003EE3E4C1